MATSGTYNWSMSIDEVIEEALEMVGGEQTSGHEPKSARRSINLILNDWQNRGITLWSTDTTVVSVTTSVTTVALTSSTLDVLEAVLNRDDTDLVLTRISMQEYLQQPTKGRTGRPTQFAVRPSNSSNAPTVFLWPIPENSTDTIRFEQVKYLQDVNKSEGQTADIARRFFPALTAGVAYEMGIKRDIGLQKLALIKGDYEAKLQRAMEEDRERVSMYILPKIRV